ncbi:MAG: hypothetical protein ABJO02_00150, partial [Reichenbachiella sp.]
MDLRELVPEVPDIPALKLNLGSRGIYVTTLQIWLKILDFDKVPIDEDDDPKLITVSGDVNVETKSALDRFHKQEGIVAPSSGIIEYNGWKKLDELLRAKLPPNPETLERPPFPERKTNETDEIFNDRLKTGLEVFGFEVMRRKGIYFINVDESGIGSRNIPPGIYEVELIQSTSNDNEQAESSNKSGRMEIKLKDESGNAISGKVKLTNNSAEPDSLKKNYKLFQALVGKVEELKNDKGEDINLGVIDGEIRKGHENSWDTFSDTWGQFYAAPWMGIFYDPTEGGKLATEPGDCNWSTAATLKILYEWGKQITSGDQNTKFVTVKYLNDRHGLLYSKGDAIAKYDKYPQAGNGAVIYLPSKSSLYANISYQSSDYDTNLQKDFITSFLRLQQNEMRVRMADEVTLNNAKNAEAAIKRGVLKVDSTSDTELIIDSPEIIVPLFIERGLVNESTTKHLSPPSGAIIKAIYKDGSIRRIPTSYKNGNITLPRKFKSKGASPIEYLYIDTHEGYSLVQKVEIGDYSKIPQALIIKPPSRSSYYYDYSPPMQIVLVPGNIIERRYDQTRDRENLKIEILFKENSEYVSIGWYGVIFLKFNFPSKSELTQSFIENHALVKLKEVEGLDREGYVADFGYQISEYKEIIPAPTYHSYWYSFFLRNDYYLKDVNNNSGAITLRRAVADQARTRSSGAYNFINRIKSHANRVAFEKSRSNKEGQLSILPDADGYRNIKVLSQGTYRWIRLVDNKPTSDNRNKPGLDIEVAKGLQKEFPAIALAVAIDCSGSMGDDEKKTYRKQVKKKNRRKVAEVESDRLYNRALNSVKDRLFTEEATEVMAKLEAFEFWRFFYKPYNKSTSSWPEIIEPLFKDPIEREVEETISEKERHENQVMEVSRVVKRKASKDITDKLAT